MKRVNLLAALCMAVLLTAVLTACGSESALDNKSKNVKVTTSEASAEATALYLVGEADYRPISYEQNGEVVGISPDILREAFQRIGYKIKIELYPWKRVKEMVKNGDADACFSSYKTSDREAIYLFPSEPLLLEKNILMVRKDSTIEFDGDISKLNKYTFATVDGYATLNEYIENGKITKIDKSKSGEEALKKLLSGDHNVDIVINTNFILWDIVKKMGKNLDAKKLKTPLSVIPAYLAFTKKKDMTAISVKLDAELKKMKQDGSYDKIIAKYVGN